MVCLDDRNKVDLEGISGEGTGPVCLLPGIAAVRLPKSVITLVKATPTPCVCVYSFQIKIR